MSKLIVVNGIRRGMSYAAAFQWTTGTLNEALLESPFPWGEDDGDWSELKVEVFDNELPEAPSQTRTTIDDMQAVRLEMNAIRTLRAKPVTNGALSHSERIRLDSCFAELLIRYQQLANQMTYA